jgi:hypothetical protein
VTFMIMRKPDRQTDADATPGPVPSEAIMAHNGEAGQ